VTFERNIPAPPSQPGRHVRSIRPHRQRHERAATAERQLASMSNLSNEQVGQALIEAGLTRRSALIDALDRDRAVIETAPG
jgi:hypothetical protein